MRLWNTSSYGLKLLFFSLNVGQNKMLVLSFSLRLWGISVGSTPKRHTVSWGPLFSQYLPLIFIFFFYILYPIFCSLPPPSHCIPSYSVAIFFLSTSAFKVSCQSEGHPAVCFDWLWSPFEWRCILERICVRSLCSDVLKNLFW